MNVCVENLRKHLHLLLCFQGRYFTSPGLQMGNFLTFLCSALSDSRLHKECCHAEPQLQNKCISSLTVGFLLGSGISLLFQYPPHSCAVLRNDAQRHCDSLVPPGKSWLQHSKFSWVLPSPKCWPELRTFLLDDIWISLCSFKNYFHQKGWSLLLTCPIVSN